MATIVVSKKVVFVIIGMFLLLAWLSVSNLQTQKSSFAILNAILEEHTESLDEAFSNLYLSMRSGSYEEVSDKLDRVEDILVRRRPYDKERAARILDRYKEEASNRLQSSISPDSLHEVLKRLDGLQSLLFIGEVNRGVERVASAVSDNRQSLQEVSDKLDVLHHQLDNLQDSIGSDKLYPVEHRLINLQLAIGEQKYSTDESLSDKLDGLHERLDRLEYQLIQIGSRLGVR